jgi:hypothetical protein
VAIHGVGRREGSFLDAPVKITGAGWILSMLLLTILDNGKRRGM